MIELYANKLDRAAIRSGYLAKNWKKASREVQLGRVFHNSETQTDYAVTQVETTSMYSTVNELIVVQFAALAAIEVAGATCKGSSLADTMSYPSSFSLSMDRVEDRQFLRSLIPSQSNILRHEHIEPIPLVGTDSSLLETDKVIKDFVTGVAVVKGEDGGLVRQVRLGNAKWHDIPASIAGGPGN